MTLTLVNNIEIKYIEMLLFITNFYFKVFIRAYLLLRSKRENESWINKKF